MPLKRQHPTHLWDICHKNVSIIKNVIIWFFHIQYSKTLYFQGGSDMSYKAYRILILHFYWFRSIIYKSWISRIASVEGDKDVSKQDATSNTFGYGWNTGSIHGVTEEHGCSECTAWFYKDVKDRATILKHTHVSHKVRKFMMNFFSNLLFFMFHIFMFLIFP